MRIENLTTENVSDYTEFLTQDIAGWIGRSFVCGFVLLPEEEPAPVAGMVWQLVSGEDEYETDSRILFIKAEDDENADLLLNEYSELAKDMDCERSLFQLPAVLGGVEKKALERAGFTLETGEGEVVSLALADLGMALITEKDGRREDIKRLGEADERSFDVAMAELEMDGISGTCMDLAYLPKDFFENDISCFLDDGGDISAMILFHKRASGKIELDLMSGVGEYETDGVELFKQAVLFSEGIYAPNTKFLFDRSDENTAAFLNGFFPKAKGAQVVAGSGKRSLPRMRIWTRRILSIWRRSRRNTTMTIWNNASPMSIPTQNR